MIVTDQSIIDKKSSLLHQFQYTTTVRKKTIFECETNLTDK